MPIREHILRTVDDVAVAGTELGGDDALLEVERIVREGTGAERQLATFAESGDLRAVARAIANETSPIAASAA